MTANGKDLYPQPTKIPRFPISSGMVAITNDVFMEFPLPAPLYRAKLFIMDKDGNEIQGMGILSMLQPMDTRERFAVDFRAAILEDDLISSLHPGNGSCGFSLMTIDYLAAYILTVLPGKLNAWANTATGEGEPSIMEMKIGVVLFRVCSQY
jgi:hypothetical protein